MSVDLQGLSMRSRIRIPFHDCCVRLVWRDKPEALPFYPLDCINTGDDFGLILVKWRLLIIFCVINMLNYVDRGAIASNGVNGSIKTCTESGICTSGSGIQGDFNLNYFQDGVLSSAFMVGLLVASPIFASLSKIHNPFRLIGVGLSVWTFAVAGCGCSFDFWTITICRMLVGVGEASFISLAAPFIDDNAPPAQKTAWLAVFYMCIPTGIALGYVYGGLVGDHLNWRAAFWGEAILMLPFAVLGFVIKPLQLKGFTSSGSKKASNSVESVAPEQQGTEISKDTGDVLAVKVDLDDNISKKSSLSKAAGGFLNQWARFRKDMKVLLVDKVYVVNVLGYIAYNFVIGAYSYWGPKAGYDIYHMAPVNYVCLHCVTPSMRALSMAMSTVSIHIFGDVPSSPLVGVLQDYINNWRETALILTSVLFLAAAIWFGVWTGLMKKVRLMFPRLKGQISSHCLMEIRQLQKSLLECIFSYLQQFFFFPKSNADLIFGGVTIVCGICGTLAGGYILDYIDATISNAFKLLSGATFLGAIFCFSAFCSKNLYVFIALFAVGELLVFATQAPVNYVCLHCVTPSMRALSMAMSTVSIHIFGDVPSSPLVGVLQDYINNWRETALILTSVLFLAAAIWFGGIFLHSVDRFNEEGETNVPPIERSNQQPLLDGNTTAPEEFA
ncbi:putative sphingolipid transporter spinster [Cinnamomum micranthum f. kanehirae]|uniref:Putative sphingolipid transporter spinster n=1 Tax=Cinnamomum micranthum f. kanehirae TaxID=337451 RepID=A0A3S3MCT0_9MAGN|nr:putative sphingolipid transporter spinster [Cinnamomum micranthum f. kanehirae]